LLTRQTVQSNRRANQRLGNIFNELRFQVCQKTNACGNRFPKAAMEQPPAVSEIAAIF